HPDGDHADTRGTNKDLAEPPPEPSARSVNGNVIGRNTGRNTGRDIVCRHLQRPSRIGGLRFGFDCRSDADRNVTGHRDRARKRPQLLGRPSLVGALRRTGRAPAGISHRWSPPLPVTGASMTCFGWDAIATVL